MRILPILLVLFISIPLVELYLLLAVGSAIGLLWTFTIVILTGIVGAGLARWQGFSVWMRIRRRLHEGVMPAREVIEGVMVLVAAVLLVTPGLLTDSVGFLLLIHPLRRLLAGKIYDWLERRMMHGGGRGGFVDVN